MEINLNNTLLLVGANGIHTGAKSPGSWTGWADDAATCVLRDTSV